MQYRISPSTDRALKVRKNLDADGGTRLPPDAPCAYSWPRQPWRQLCIEENQAPYQDYCRDTPADDPQLTVVPAGGRLRRGTDLGMRDLSETLGAPEAGQGP